MLKRFSLPDLLAVVLAAAAAIPVMLSPYDLWFPVAFVFVLAIWSVIRYCLLLHELKTALPAIGTVVEMRKEIRRAGNRDLTVWVPVVEYETQTQNMRSAYHLFFVSEVYRVGQKRPIRYCARHPWQFYFENNYKPLLSGAEILMAMLWGSSLLYGGTLGIAYLLA